MKDIGDEFEYADIEVDEVGEQVVLVLLDDNEGIDDEIELIVIVLIDAQQQIIDEVEVEVIVELDEIDANE